MISLQEAQATNFVTSTRAELRKYAEELGLDVSPVADSEQLKRAVFNSLGIAMNPEQTAAAHRPVVTTTRGGDQIFPSYNLTPDGIWGGRRHRMSLPRPEGTKLAKAECYWWNGKHPYYIAYGEVTDVPEPIYQIIVTNRRPRTKNIQPEGGTPGESTTVWEFDAQPHSYHGVDPVTANRAGSLMEWYRSRGTKWFGKLDERQLTRIATLCTVSVTQSTGVNMPARLLSKKELHDRLLEFFFGYADAQAEPNEKIEA